MLELHIPGEERWDERTNMFVYDEDGNFEVGIQPALPV